MTDRHVRSAWMRRIAVTACVIAATIALAIMPVTTKQGVNFEVASHRLPLYQKSLQFVERSTQYAQIAGEITANARSDRERVMDVFDWTRRRIRQTPDGWPIVDDHILNIIIRGYGLNDQQADVFTTLSTYAGVPAFWAKVPPSGDTPHLLLSFARVDGRWRVFDVAEGAVFRAPSGQLATLDDLAAHPESIPPSLRTLTVDGVRYTDLITHAAMPSVPHPLRAELQMPSVRLWHELKAAAHFESSDQ